MAEVFFRIVRNETPTVDDFRTMSKRIMTMAGSGNVIFELVDLSPGNVVNDFADVAEALASVRRVAGLHGWDMVQNLALLRLDGDDQALVAMQGSLADLAASAEHATATSRVP